jgi:transcriptional regulator with XRE-family HTH domain
MLAIAIRHRIKALGVEQRDLAAAADVTESYISQLLAHKKSPPAPNRTDIYEKMEQFLQLPTGELSKLAEVQRKDDLKSKIAEPARPLFKEFRELILRKCKASKRLQLSRIFHKEPYGELERLITQSLLDVAKRVAKEELGSEDWLRSVAGLSGRSYAEMRVLVLEFLDTDVFNISAQSCVSVLDPLIDAWDIDLKSFGIEIVLNRTLTNRRIARLEFLESQTDETVDVEPGLEEFLKNASLSGDVTAEEIEILRRLKIKGRTPTAMYYYRELQSLRDPLNFSLPLLRKLKSA